jgi:tetratricopeptide (TPR) repeat protein
MSGKFWWISIAAVIISFIGGFFLANTLNRGELDKLRVENEKLKTAPPQNAPGGESLSEEEIQQKIKEADQNPQNFNFQKDLGIALYRYATMKQKVAMLNDVERLLTRANSINANDYDVLVVLGNAVFDIGYANKSNEKFEQAREIYLKALKQKPEDIEVQTDLSLTYFFSNPPDYAKAIEELNKTLKKNPNHERTLQFVVQAYLKAGKKQEAADALAKLKQINPNNKIIPELEAELNQTQ